MLTIKVDSLHEINQYTYRGMCILGNGRGIRECLKHATDKGAKNDFTAWVKASGHKILAGEDDNGLIKFWIEKA